MHAEWDMVAIGVGVLIGAVAGLYFRVAVILVPLTILALLGMAVVDVANGLTLRIMLFHMGYIWFGLQFTYFGISFLVSRSQRKFQSAERENVPNNMYAAEPVPRGRAVRSARGHRGRGVAKDTIALSS